MSSTCHAVVVPNPEVCHFKLVALCVLVPLNLLNAPNNINRPSTKVLFKFAYGREKQSMVSHSKRLKIIIHQMLNLFQGQQGKRSKLLMRTFKFSTKRLCQYHTDLKNSDTLTPYHYWSKLYNVYFTACPCIYKLLDEW